VSWERARRLLRLSRFARGADARGQALPEASMDPFAAVRAGSICVASGKGGTGKSVVCASLGALLAHRGRTLIVDADMGIGNAHILQGVSPERTFVEVVAGDVSVREIVTPCREQLDLIAAGSGVSNMAGLTSYEMHHIAEGLEELELRYSFLLVDSAAGVSNQTVAFAAASDVVLLVTTPDVTSMTDAYAFLKVLLRSNSTLAPLLVVNRARSFAQAQAVAARMESVSKKFLGRTPRWVGWIPEDDAVAAAVNAREPLSLYAPRSRAAQVVGGLAVTLVEELDRVHTRGLGRSLLRRVGYSPKLGAKSLAGAGRS